MGQANNRGTFEQRRDAAIARNEAAAQQREQELQARREAEAQARLKAEQARQAQQSNRATKRNGPRILSGGVSRHNMMLAASVMGLTAFQGR